MRKSIAYVFCSTLAAAGLLKDGQNRYTLEVTPTANRSTGAGLALGLGRIASLSSPLIATFGDLTSGVPIWVLVGIYGLIALVACILPFEPQKFTEAEGV